MKNTIINSVSIVGMGALGLLYAHIIQRTLGAGVVRFVMDQERLRRNDGVFTVNGKEERFSISAPEGVSDLVIVAVKYSGLKDALEMMKPIVGDNTIIISVMNGIVSEEIIASSFGKEKVLYSVAQAMDAMKDGSRMWFTKEGELRIGYANGGTEENLKSLEDFFNRSGIHFTEEEDIISRLWGKFMLNTGINQTCMAFGLPYKEVLKPGKAYDTFIGAMKEVLSLGKAKGINITEEMLYDYVRIIGTLDPDGTPSMGQDRLHKRKSEVELFSGTVLRLSKECGIKCPINEELYKTIKDIEAQY